MHHNCILHLAFLNIWIVKERIGALCHWYQMKKKSHQLVYFIRSEFPFKSATLNKAAFTVQKKWCSVQQNHPEDLTHYTQHDVRLSDASHSYKHKSTVLASFALCSLTVSHFSGGQEVCRRLLSVSLQVVTILLHSDWTSQQGAASAFGPNREPPLLSIRKARLAFGQC